MATSIDLSTLIPRDNLAALLQWARTQDFRPVANMVRDSNDAILSMDIVWPDGTPGTFTADVVSTDFPGAIDAWHATYQGSTTRTVSQPLVTRNATGAAIAPVPAITIS
jgi:hypothetical protein